MSDDEMPLHFGKCDTDMKFTVPAQFKEHIRKLARLANCDSSELARDALFLAVTGRTYADHVADDRRSVLKCEVPELPQNSHTKWGGTA